MRREEVLSQGVVWNAAQLADVQLLTRQTSSRRYRRRGSCLNVDPRTTATASLGPIRIPQQLFGATAIDATMGRRMGVRPKLSSASERLLAGNRDCRLRAPVSRLRHVGREMGRLPEAV